MGDGDFVLYHNKEKNFEVGDMLHTVVGGILHTVIILFKEFYVVFLRLMEK